jgi:type I restriction enzyme S subunit
MGVENNISNEWSESTLGDLITHKKGFAFKSKDYSKNGRKIVKVKDFTSNSIDDT